MKRGIVMAVILSALCGEGVSVAGISGTGQGRLGPGDEAAFAIPRMAAPPTIDGKIDPAEWREAVAISGIVDQGTDILIPRPTTFLLGWDSGHLYFACRTYLKPGYKPNIQKGRSPGRAECWDDGLELLFKPMGRNVSAQNHKTEFKLNVNCLGNDGWFTRLVVGQIMMNWEPAFETSVRITAPGTAPDGGSWWELEVSTTPKDFELTGDHRPGDQWKLMLGFNHIPGWMQARIPCVGGYFTPDGKCTATLVDSTPAVQMTMDSLSNLASDGTAALAVKAYNPAGRAAKVRVEVDVAGKITRDETLRLPPGGEDRVELAEKLPPDVKKGTVTVRVTQDGRTLLAYTALFEVGKYKRMMAPVRPADPSKFRFIARFNPIRGRLLVKADSYYLPDPGAAKALRYSLKPEGSDKPVVEGEITRVVEYYFDDIIRLEGLAPGKYTLTGELLLAGGKTIGPMTATIQKKDEAKAFPAWWGKKFGNIERVIPPFTPITRKGNVLGCWGREYTLNALGLPSAVTSQNGAVLARPARIVVTADGKDEVVRLGEPKITEVTDWRVRFEGKAEGAGLKFQANGWIEQDGLVYVDLTYRPGDGKPIKVDALRIEYPLASDGAECLVCVGPGANFASKSTVLLPPDKQGRLWSTFDTGRKGSAMTVGSFYPTVWIGSERRGFLWWADNDKGWLPNNEVPAHEAVRDRGAVVLRNHLIGRPTELTEARTVSFSYMASPFKPLPKGWRMIAATDDGTFFQPFRGVRKDSKTGEKLWNPARGNINWIHPESRYPEEWSALWAEQKAQADKLVHDRRPFDLYGARTGISFQHMSFQLIGYGAKSIESHVYAYFGDEWFPGGHDTWNETYTDYAMYLFDRAFREGGVVSSYWDLTFPIQYESLLSGLSYRLPDGRGQRGYNGWNVRRFFMRLWALQHDYGLNPGAVGSHSTNAYVFVALPWLDAVLDGERDWHLDTGTMDWIDYYPVERMRAMSSPHNWGVGLCWMSNYTSKDKTKIVAAKISQAEYLWMHDSWLNPYIAPAKHMTVMPRPILDWGLNGDPVTYHPYWRNPHAACADKDILVSTWRIPEGGTTRVLVGVFNYDRKAPKDVEVKLDLEKLGLARQPLAVRDLYGDWVAEHLGGAKPSKQALALREIYKDVGAAPEFDPTAGTLRIAGLAPHRGRFIGVGATDPAAMEQARKNLPAWAEGGLTQAVVGFGMVRKDTKHLPPGRVSAVTCKDSAIQIGVWQLPDRVLLFVYNNSDGKRPKNVAIGIDLDELNLAPKLPWQEFIGVRDFSRPGQKGKAVTLDFYGRTLTVKGLRPKSGRIIGIRRY